ncbi:sodium:solute symporter [Micromonospora sp. NPDC005299]|uniref:sodium:solute symporter family protein n=1 Tax=Micromonospora sp. NPDC005299 TaxID=3364231 RepID=UPI0036B31607
MSIWIYGLLFVYLGVILAVGFLAGKKTRDDPESFYVADRQLNWKQEGLSVFSSAATGAALLGTIGQFYGLKGGFLGYAVGYAVFGPALYWLMGSRLRRLGARYGYQTQAEFLGHYFGSKTLSLASSIMTVGLLMVYMAVLPIAVSSAMAKYTGLNYNVGVVLFLVVALSYTLYGGLRAVAQTDVWHGMILLAFLLLLVGGLVWAAGGPLDLISAPESQSYQFIPSTNSGLLIFLPWLITIAVSIVSLPDRSHRMFSAKNDKNLRQAVILMGATLGFTSFAFLFSGMALNILVPGVKKTDGAILLGLEGHAKWLIPLFVVNVWGASIAAASMHMLTVANVFMKDIYAPLHRRLNPAAGASADPSGRRSVQVGRVMMLLTAFVALLVSAGQPKVIFDIVGVVLGLFSQFGVIFLLTLFWRRTTKAGVVSGLVVGIGLTLMWQYAVASPFGMAQPSVIALAANVAVTVVVSLLTQGVSRRAGEAVDTSTEKAGVTPGHEPEGVLS